MQPSKILPECLLPLRPDILKVLIAEDDDSPLRDQQCELVLLPVRQLRQLQAADLGADERRQLRHDDVRVARCEEVRLRLVSRVPTVGELEWRSGLEFGLLVVNGEVA